MRHLASPTDKVRVDFSNRVITFVGLGAPTDEPCGLGGEQAANRSPRPSERPRRVRRTPDAVSAQAWPRCQCDVESASDAT
jgi:hypothetical protein